ncbi:MAG: outer membrane protein assembly factor BamE [Holosporales bacterium]|nr:outer membrane protein assembly factor BamE [Holosporales bacterium]
MIIIGKIKTLSFLGAMLFVLTSCEKVVINHGYIIESANFQEINVKKDTAMVVYEKFGAPTLRSSVVAPDGSYNWYYVSKRTEKTSFFNPKVLDEKTVVVSFDKDNVVTSVNTVSPGKLNKTVNVVSEKTKTGGKTAGVLGETFGGLGKYMKHYTEAERK